MATPFFLSSSTTTAAATVILVVIQQPGAEHLAVTPAWVGHLAVTSAWVGTPDLTVRFFKLSSINTRLVIAAVPELWQRFPSVKKARLS